MSTRKNMFRSNDDALCEPPDDTAPEHPSAARRAALREQVRAIVLAELLTGRDVRTISSIELAGRITEALLRRAL